MCPVRHMYLTLYTSMHTHTHTHLLRTYRASRIIRRKRVRLLIRCEQTPALEFATNVFRRVVPTCHSFRFLVLLPPLFPFLSCLFSPFFILRIPVHQNLSSTHRDSFHHSKFLLLHSCSNLSRSRVFPLFSVSLVFPRPTRFPRSLSIFLSRHRTCRFFSFNEFRLYFFSCSISRLFSLSLSLYLCALP